jgi:hypothetical protein
MASKDPDRRGASFLVPLGISVVFILLVIGWVSMSGHRDSSSGKDVLSRPSSPGRTVSGVGAGLAPYPPQPAS